MEKPVLGQWLSSRKHTTSMSSKLDPAIWSRDTGQRIPCDRCPLTIKCSIKWMSRGFYEYGVPF